MGSLEFVANRKALLAEILAEPAPGTPWRFGFFLEVCFPELSPGTMFILGWGTKTVVSSRQWLHR